MTERPKEFGGQPVEKIVKQFETNFEIYSKNLEETGLVDDPSKLFVKKEDEERRAGLLSGAAAFFSLPESVGARIQLILEAKKKNQEVPLLEGARNGLVWYIGAAHHIRQELGMDWRNAVAQSLKEAGISNNEVLTQEQIRRVFVVKFAEMLDKVLLVIPLSGKNPSIKDVIEVVKKAPSYGLIKTSDELDLCAYLEEFLVARE